MIQLFESMQELTETLDAMLAAGLDEVEPELAFRIWESRN